MKTLVLLSLMQLGAAAGDGFATNRGAQQPRWREADPIARPFVRTARGTSVYFSLTAGGTIVGSFVLFKHHHNRLATIVLAAGIASNSYGAISTTKHTK